MLEALYICFENFVTYWGQQLVNVLRALHNIRYTLDNDDDECDDCVTYSFSYVLLRLSIVLHDGLAAPYCEQH